ncbi:type IV pilin protein [Haliangium sp.]|uniref:type IV pilin protein n=1 Tax=Haliangium sp. TaxID=2663208 RepID=UPI003D0AAA90
MYVTTDDDTTAHRDAAGFSLLEMMIVVAVIGILATIALFNGSIYEKRARRTEVTLVLDAVRDAQRVHYLEHRRYTDSFQQLTALPESAVMNAPNALTSHQYTYFLTQPHGDQAYQLTVVGQLDSDPFPDIHILEVVRQ